MFYNKQVRCSHVQLFLRTIIQVRQTKKKEKMHSNDKKNITTLVRCFWTTRYVIVCHTLRRRGASLTFRCAVAKTADQSAFAAECGHKPHKSPNLQHRRIGACGRISISPEMGTFRQLGRPSISAPPDSADLRRTSRPPLLIIAAPNRNVVTSNITKQFLYATCMNTAAAKLPYEESEIACSSHTS